MYLHIGHDWMIASDTIIAIFPRPILDHSPEFRHLFHTWRIQGLVLGDWSVSKSVILTDERIFLSAISAKTLKRRTERGEWQFD
jgi:hypothetical protein